MEKSLVLKMDDAKGKLNDLKKYMPRAQDHTCEFGRYLATRLNDELVPEGFVLGCELALYDLQKGVDGFTGEPIRSGLVGYPPMIYALLRMEFPHIAKAIFPEDFAAGVADFVQKVREDMTEKQSEG